MNLFLTFVLGAVAGYVFSSLLTCNTYQEELDEAFKRGREYEREHITKILDEQKDSNA
jgi:hypothetical protein